MARLLIGIDDTDYGDSIGTGALARELGLHLERLAGATNRGITRHQLLIDPRIPYTSHNSAACLEIDVAVAIDEIETLACAFITTLLHVGADPGLCVVEPNGTLQSDLMQLGRRAQTEIVEKSEALDVCRRLALRQHELGGSGLGVIGAAAACGLRLSGDDGRFISLAGTRELDGVLTVGEILSRSPIQKVVDDDGQLLGEQIEIDTAGWVRPDLIGGKVVLKARRYAPDQRYVVVRDKHRDKH